MEVSARVCHGLALRCVRWCELIGADFRSIAARLETIRESRLTQSRTQPAPHRHGNETCEDRTLTSVLYFVLLYVLAA